MKKYWKWITIAVLVVIIIILIIFLTNCNCRGANDRDNEYTSSTHTVTFYTDSAESFNIPSQQVKDGGFVIKPKDPVKDGYYFVGWYSSATLESYTLWEFSTHEVHTDTTLYARWEKKNS